MRSVFGRMASSVALVVFFTLLIAVTTELPFWLPLCVLSFNWIAAPLIGRWFESRHPSHDEEAEPGGGIAWGIFAFWMVVFAIAGGVLSWKTDLPYFTAFAYVLLVASSVLALNAIVIDWEDNQKGGWLNP